MATHNEILLKSVAKGMFIGMEKKYIAALHKAYLFQGIDDPERTALMDCFSPKVRRFSKNETIFFTGDSVSHIGIILNGTARAYLEHANGNQVIMSTLTPMSVFGEILASTRSLQSPVTVCAESEVTAAFIDYRKVCSTCPAACAAHRMFLQNMLTVIGDKYFQLFDRISILREKTLRSKILTYFFSLSGNGESAVVKLPFSKTMLADYLLANRSALSKELKKMELDGLIAVKGREVTLSRGCFDV